MWGSGLSGLQIRAKPDSLPAYYFGLEEFSRCRKMSVTLFAHSPCPLTRAHSHCITLSTDTSIILLSSGSQATSIHSSQGSIHTKTFLATSPGIAPALLPPFREPM